MVNNYMAILYGYNNREYKRSPFNNFKKEMFQSLLYFRPYFEVVNVGRPFNLIHYFQHYTLGILKHEQALIFEYKSS